MLYMLINRTKPGLSADDYETLGKLARAFYENIPEGLKLHGDWSATDGSRTFALMETEDPRLLEQIQSPFRAFVDIEMIPVISVSGWQKVG